MLLIVPGLALWAWRERDRGCWRAASTRLISVGAIVGICAAPVLWWNILHHGAGVAHLWGLLKMHGGDRPLRPFTYRPEWTGAFLASQIGVIGPMLAVVIVAVRTASRDTAEAREA